MRLAWIALLCLLTTAVWAFAPHAACWSEGNTTRVAALAEGQLHLGSVADGVITDLATLPIPGITTLAVGRWQGKAALLGAERKQLLRFDDAGQRWETLGTVPAAIRKILPAPGNAAGALLLTGTSDDRTKNDGAVWWAEWKGAFSINRITAVKDVFHPWQLWWTRVDGEQRFVAATYKATPMVKFPHNCMFVFAWQGKTAEPRWLGSRLSRPYVDATHADLRGDGQWRMAAVEVTRDGGRGLSVYHPIGFGYEGEWRTERIPGLQRIAAFGTVALCWGKDASGSALAWRLLPVQDGYQLLPLPEAPPALEAVTLIDPAHLAGWWNGAWHVIPLLLH